MKEVYLLWFVHRFPDGEEDDGILVGVYESSIDAQAAKARVIEKPVFRDQPEGFQISPNELGKDHWTSAFITE